MGKSLSEIMREAEREAKEKPEEPIKEGRKYTPAELAEIAKIFYEITAVETATVWLQYPTRPLFIPWEQLSPEERRRAVEGLRERIEREGLRGYLERKRPVAGKLTDAIIQALEARGLMREAEKESPPIAEKASEKITFENLAWRGIRLMSTPLRRGDKEYIWEIGYHVPLKKFYVETDITHFERTPPETYGKHEFYGDSVEECLRWIERTYNVATEVKDWQEVLRQEEYVRKEYFKERGMRKGNPINKCFGEGFDSGNELRLLVNRIYGAIEGRHLTNEYWQKATFQDIRELIDKINKAQCLEEGYKKVLLKELDYLKRSIEKNDFIMVQDANSRLAKILADPEYWLVAYQIIYKPIKL